MTKEEADKKKTAKTTKKVEADTTLKKMVTKKTLIIGTVVVAIVAVAAIILVVALVVDSNSDLTAAKLITQFSKTNEFVTDIIEFDDPDGIAGGDNEYTSKSSWDDSRLTDISEDHAGTVEVFKNEEDAKIREWYLGEAHRACEKVYTVEKYGKDYYEQICGGIGYGTMYRNKNVVLRLSRAYSEEQASDYKRAFNSIIQNFKISDKDTPSQEQIDKIKEQKLSLIDSLYEEQETKFKNGLDGLASDMDKNLDTALADPTNIDVDDLKNSVAYLKTIPYFADKIAGWEKRISEVENKISEKQRADEEAERAKQAAKTRTFSAGKYVVGRDIDSGTYNVTAISGSGNFFVDNSSGRLTINEVMSPSGGKYYLTNYNNAYLGMGYEIEIKGNLVLKFEAL